MPTLTAQPSSTAKSPTTGDARNVVAAAIRKVTTIATLPEVTSRIIATVENPTSSASQLHKIVAHDPALVTRILKVVNSAFYGLPGQIGSIERAIVLLGLNAVKNIAVAASLGQLFRNTKLCDGFTARDLWTHCIAVAVTARELARQMQLPVLDEAFLAGLIHDVGILVAMHIAPDHLRTACEQVRAGAAVDGKRLTFCELERQVMGVDHQQLGQGLTEHWKFTRPCQLVAGFHHNPTLLADDTRLLVTLVYVADTLSCQAHRGFDLTAIEQTLETAKLAEVKLSMDAIERVHATLDQQIAAATGVLLQ